MTNATLRVAIYCRVGSASQLGLEAQEHAMLAFAREQGYLNPVIYTDNGFSGLNFERPSFVKLNAAIDAGEVGAVLVRDLSRIGRGYIEVYDWLSHIKAKGVKVRSLDGSCEGDFSAPFRDMLDTYRRAKKKPRHKIKA